MFEAMQRVFWKALTPDLIADVLAPASDVADSPRDEPVLAAPVLAALGGESNLKSCRRVALTRLRVELHDPTRFDAQAVQAAGIAGQMACANGAIHLLVGLD